MRQLLAWVVAILLIVLGVGITNAQQAAKIQFWHHTIIPEAKIHFDNQVAQWNRENPGVQVEASVIRPLTEQRIKFISAFKAGQSPDIAYFTAPFLPELVLMGALEPLDRLLGRAFFNQYTDAINRLHTLKGGIYAIPFEGPTWGMFYRKDLFKEAGLDPERPPADWQELLSYARRLTKRDASGRITQYGLAFPARAHEIYEYWLPFVHQAGGQLALFDAQADNWKSALGTRAARVGTEFWVSLVRNEKVTPPAEVLVGLNWEGVARGLVSGEYAMIFDGMWAMSTIQQALPKDQGKWGTALVPGGPAGRSSLGFSVSLSVSSQSKYKREVARFLTWLLAGERHNLYAILTTTMSWRKDFLETRFASDPFVRPFVEATRFAVAPPGTPHFAVYRDKVLWPTLQQILLGQLTVDAGLRQLEAEFKKMHE